MNNTDIQSWYKFSKIQIVAESYLDLFIQGGESLSEAIQRQRTTGDRPQFSVNSRQLVLATRRLASISIAA